MQITTLSKSQALIASGLLFFSLLLSGGQAFAQTSPQPKGGEPAGTTPERNSQPAQSSAQARPATPTLEIRFPNGGNISCPLREIKTQVLIFFSSHDLNTNPGEECLQIVAQLERQQNIEDLRAVLYHMQGKTQEEYQRALADFLLGRIGVPSSRIAEVRVRIDSRDFLEWSDQEVITDLNQQYLRNTMILLRIREVRLRHPGALLGSP